MSCCSPAGMLASPTGTLRDEALAGELRLASRPLENGVRQTELSVPSMHCAACIQTIEASLAELPNVEHARVNLTARRVAIRWRGETPPPMIQALERAGYPAFPFDAAEQAPDPVRDELLRALAVAGFSAMNIMLMSVAVWGGAAGEARELFHWISALLALPALIFAGRIFFVSGWNALRRGRTNMDVPISIGVLLAFGMSLYDTITHGEHAYFDAAASLLFFLLIGRTLDHLMRERARSAVTGLARLVPRVARRMTSVSDWEVVPVSELAPGMLVQLDPGERVPVDGVVVEGNSDLDQSLVNGESVPRPIGPGAKLVAGTLNLTGPLTLRATATADGSFLSEMIRLMDAAGDNRSAYRRIADRAARLYAPAVHLTALASLVGWFIATRDLHQAATIAVAVLIITCPCALGLAVPMVQVMTTRRLFEAGILVKDGGAIERLAEVDTVLFDKTGTLTLGHPRLVNAGDIPSDALRIAAALGAHSQHPYSRALAALEPTATGMFDLATEVPGHGVEGRLGDHVYRLGHAVWAAGRATEGTVLARDGALLASFRFEDIERPGAKQAVADLAVRGLGLEIVSGDAPGPVEAQARALGVLRWSADLRPADKVEHIRALQAAGRKVLMVGDGLNDAPALAAADVSMAPGEGAEIGRNAADTVFLRRDLGAVATALSLAARSARLVQQNFVLAVLYNVLALPLAITGHVTPLIAALAMSASSITVMANSMRPGPGRKARTTRADARTTEATAS